MNECREDFEKWAKSEGLYLTQDKYGYVLPNTAAAWEAWCHLSHAEEEGWRSGYPEHDGDGGVCHIPLSGHPDFMVVAFNSDGNLVDSCGDDVGYSLEDVERWRPIDAPTAPAGEPEFYVEHKTLRSAMAYVGIAAPESDEELGAEMERHAKRVIRAAAKLLAQQPVSDPDGLPSDWRRVIEGAADMLGESAKQHRERGNSATAAMCDRFSAMLRDEILSAPAPDEREIARPGYAGVTVWIGDQQCTQVVDRTVLETSRADELLRHFENAQHLLRAGKEDRT